MSEKPRSFIEIGEGRSYVRVAWETVGGDIQVTVTGGEAPHIGACALAHCVGGDVTASVIALPGHKEAELALEFAKAVCAKAGCAVSVVCGIHIDRATPAEVALLVSNARLLKAQWDVGDDGAPPQTPPKGL